MTRLTLIIGISSAIIILAGVFLFDGFLKSDQIPEIVETPVVINEPSPTPTSIQIVKTKENISKKETEIMAWVYPGSSTCFVKNEYADGRKIDLLKPEYFTLDENGKMVLLTEENRGCNGYSLRNVADLKKYSKAQYATFSSSYAVNMDLFLTESINNKANVDALVSFVVSNDMTGIEIDFEDFGGWNTQIY